MAGSEVLGNPDEVNAQNSVPLDDVIAQELANKLGGHLTDWLDILKELDSSEKEIFLKAAGVRESGGILRWLRDHTLVGL